MSQTLAVWALLGAAACSAQRGPGTAPAALANAPQPPQQAQSQPAAAVAASASSPPSAAAPPPADEFLTLGDDLVLRSLGTSASRPLARRATAALYDAALELVWVRNGSALQVLDLRANTLAPIAIASGLPEASHLDVFHAHQPAVALQPETSCDSGNVVILDWQREPALETHTGGPARRTAPDAAGRQWLSAHWARSARSLPARPQFVSTPTRVQLPDGLAHCDDAELCGRALPWGERGLQLVLVKSERGADCNHYACLLYDPAANLFATPPAARNWGPVTATAAGTCGPFLFNRAQTSYLVGTDLCGPDERCTALGARGLGWLVPGPVVGERSIDF